MELTNAIKKTIVSLGEAKHRRKLGLFKAEGTKCVLDTIASFRIKYLVATHQWLNEHKPGCVSDDVIITVSPSEMGRISELSSPTQVIAVYEIPDYKYDNAIVARNLSIALDSVQDPGNLGTIIRTADWFGIRDIFCSAGTADVYNPKVVQATMGGISRVRVHYVDLAEFISSIKGIPIYGTFLNGDDISHADLTSTGIIIMGNEGNGISPSIEKLVTHRLTIPSFPKGAETSESLNVAIATAIVVSQFRLK